MGAQSSTLGTALVIGGSLAGSCVAAALASHYDDVLVLERDDLPKEPSNRRGVPHGRQFHLLTVGGRLAMEDLFPGLTDDLRAAGAPFTDPMLTSRYSSKFGPFPRQPSHLRMLQVSRRHLEFYVRERSRQLPNVEFVPGTRVTGLEVSDGWVTGVSGTTESDQAVTIPADFVVDASGRQSQAPAWLAAAGYPKPVETTVNARWGYATAEVQVPDTWDPGWTSIYTPPTVSGQGASRTRGAAMWPQENHVVIVTAQGCAGDFPPGDIASFKEYLRSFGGTEFLKVVEEHGTIDGVEVWRNTTNRLRDYAGLQARPEAFVVVGDAVAAYNPIYGQGMAMAAVGARALGDAVRGHVASGAADLKGFAQQFQCHLHEMLMPCWEFSTIADFKIPGVALNGVVQESAKRSESEYADRLLALATEDPEIALKFTETVQLVRDKDWMTDEAVRRRVQADWDRLGTLIGA
jgi:2-polyprenyl-6-methoxyphenol hydroxylase-like FAD-dependent oxidoreductase